MHVNGAFYVTQPAFANMRENGYGRIVFTSSAAGLFGSIQQANYAAAKGGVFGLANVVALEGAPHGILANTILPAAVSHGSGHERGPVRRHADHPGARRTRNDQRPGRIPGQRIEHPLARALLDRTRPYARVFMGVTPGWHVTADEPSPHPTTSLRTSTRYEIWTGTQSPGP